MEAYVFWHRVLPGVDLKEYEEYLVQFHEKLNAVRGNLSLGSTTYKIRGAPWMSSETQAYEDWYYIRSSTDLDLINELAVSPRLREYHDKVALLSTDGKGTLLALKSGETEFRDRDFALWMNKPPGVKYEEFYATFGPLLNKRALWRRLLAMGPSPEFCLIGEDVPDDGIKVSRKLIFSSGFS